MYFFLKVVFIQHNLISAPPNVKIGNQTENGTEPSAPITKKGILTSFKTGKPMNIPDNDVVGICVI